MVEAAAIFIIAYKYSRLYTSQAGEPFYASRNSLSRLSYIVFYRFEEEGISYQHLIRPGVVYYPR